MGGGVCFWHRTHRLFNIFSQKLREDKRMKLPTSCLFQNGLNVCNKDKSLSSKQPTEAVEFNRNITLYQACKEGNLKAVKYILSQGLADINSRWGKRRRTPVMVAAREGHFGVFEYLVSQGCQLSCIDSHKNNVLHLACVGGNADIVRKLIVSEGLNRERRGKHSIKPIQWAARYGQKEVFELLVSLGCNLRVVNDYNDNILHSACFGGDVDIVQIILSRNIVSKESKGRGGMTPILVAAAKGQRDVFDFLVEKGCYLGAVDYQRNNLLHAACIGGNVDIVGYILSQYIDSIESRGVNGMTPVLLTARAGKKTVFDFLVEKGCNLRAVDHERNNILHEACIGGHVDLVNHILKQNIVSIESKGQSGRTPISVAATAGKNDVVQFLVQKGCNLKAVDDQGNNILHIACALDNVDIVQYILSQNKVSIESRGQAGRTPVFFAAWFNQKGVFEFLVEKGCNVRAVDYVGNNVLHIACERGPISLIRCLMKQRAVKGMEKIKNKYGITPVKVAESHGLVAIVRFLKGMM